MAAQGNGGGAQALPQPKTGGGGDGSHGAGDTRIEEAAGKSRKGWIVSPDFAFNPASLVGSWFHSLENDEIVEQGVVVAEPQPGVYLVQLDKLAPGAEQVQVLMTLDTMVSNENRFYDNENEARSAYALWVATPRERV
jgi:hypothetical protein